MKNVKKIMIAIGIAFAAISFSGCELVENAIFGSLIAGTWSVEDTFGRDEFYFGRDGSYSFKQFYFAEDGRPSSVASSIENGFYDIDSDMIILRKTFFHSSSEETKRMNYSVEGDYLIISRRNAELRYKRVRRS